MFAVEEKQLDIIEEIYKDELEKYKLYINTKKTETFERPFASNITIAKDMLKEYFDSYKKSMNKNEDEAYYTISGRNDLKKYLSKFRVFTKQNNVAN